MGIHVKGRADTHGPDQDAISPRGSDPHGTRKTRTCSVHSRPPRPRAFTTSSAGSAPSRPQKSGAIHWTEPASVFQPANDRRTGGNRPGSEYWRHLSALRESGQLPGQLLVAWTRGERFCPLLLGAAGGMQLVKACKSEGSQARRCTPVVPALGRVKQED